MVKTPRDKTVQTDFSGSKLPWNCTYKVNSTSHFHFSRGRVTKAMLVVEGATLVGNQSQHSKFRLDQSESRISPM